MGSFLNFVEKILIGVATLFWLIGSFAISALKKQKTNAVLNTLLRSITFKAIGSARLKNEKSFSWF